MNREGQEGYRFVAFSKNDQAVVILEKVENDLGERTPGVIQKPIGFD